MIVLAIALLLSLPASALAVGSSALSAFHTTGWDAECWVVAEESPPFLTCYTRGGLTGSIGAAGRAALTKRSGEYHHDPFAAHRLLGLDRYWKFGSQFGCVSRGTGLKCWNNSGHGWVLGPSGSYRVY